MGWQSLKFANKPVRKLMMQRAYARLHQHDVRAKQTKVCDVKRTRESEIPFVDEVIKNNMARLGESTDSKPSRSFSTSE